MTNTLIGDRDGKTYDRKRDYVRLNGQALDVWEVMKDGKWRSPADLENATGYNWASISARLRDYRKSKFSGSIVERDRAQNAPGVFVYRLIPNPAIDVGPP